MVILGAEAAVTAVGNRVDGREQYFDKALLNRGKRFEL